MTSSDFSLHGAVDLGARQAAAKRAQQRPAAASGTTSVVDVTDATFNAEVIDRSRDVPVLVDFWADWCTPCHAVSPVLEQIAREREIELVKVDYDTEPGLAERYGVQSIPNIVLFENGELRAQVVGALPKPTLERALGLA
jgi:putative thioredoxin